MKQYFACHIDKRSLMISFFIYCYYVYKSVLLEGDLAIKMHILSINLDFLNRTLGRCGQQFVV